MLGMSETAAAQSSSTLPEKRTRAATSARAEKLFQDGVAARAKGDIHEACKSFKASQNLESNTAVLLNVAWCLAQDGHRATAWGLYRSVADEKTNLEDSNAEEAKRLRNFALQEMAKLKPSLSNLTIKVLAETEIEGLEVRCDGEAVAAETWNHALPRDAGTYRITASAPNKVSWTTAVTIGSDADDEVVEIPRLRTSPPPRLLQITLAGGGALLLGAATGFYLWGVSRYHNAEQEMLNQARRDSLVEDANGQRHVALVMGIAGLACGGIAAWLYVTSGHAETSTAATNRASAHIIPSLGGASGTGLMVLGDF
jgi:hypothetical protein